MNTGFGPTWLTIVTGVFTALLLLLAVVSALAARGRLARNFFLGIRTRTVTSSDAAWRAGHAAAVPVAWLGFGVALVCAIVGAFLPPVHWGVVAAFVVTVVAAFALAGRAADRAH